MAAQSLAPQHYSPHRATPRMALAMLAAAAVFGLWKGFSTEFAGERVSAPHPTSAGAASPLDAAALPAVAASTDTLIPPEAQGLPAVVQVAPHPPATAPAARVAEPPPEPSPASMTQDDPRLAPAPSQQDVDEPPPPPEEEPPPDEDDPY